MTIGTDSIVKSARTPYIAVQDTTFKQCRGDNFSFRPCYTISFVTFDAKSKSIDIKTGKLAWTPRTNRATSVNFKTERANGRNEYNSFEFTVQLN